MMHTHLHTTFLVASLFGSAFPLLHPWEGYWLLRDTLDGSCLTTSPYKTWSESSIEDCATRCLREYPNCRSANFDGSSCEGKSVDDVKKLTKCSGKRYLPMVSHTNDITGVSLSTAKSGYTCDDGWSNYGANCFLYQDAPSTYDDASQTCRLNQGHVISLDNKEEHLFVTEMIPAHVDDVYLGYLRASPGRGYYWSDGNNATYTSWQEPETVSAYQNEDIRCVRMSRQKRWNWQIVSCDERLSFLCKKAGTM